MHESMHCPITVILKCKCSVKRPTSTLHPGQRKLKLDNTNKEVYQYELLSDDCQAGLQEIILEDAAMTQTIIDKMTDTLNIAIHTAAVKATNMTTCQRRGNFRKKQFKRTNRTLSSEEKHLKLAARLIEKYPKDRHIRNTYFAAKNNLKRVSKRKQREAQQELYDKLDTLHDNDPKTYWSLVHSLIDKDSSSNPIPADMTDKLHEHFQELGSKER
jgi:hypothetical protein